MKLKNTGKTIISIGRVVILPDMVGEVEDAAYENNSTIDFLIKTGRIALVADNKAVRKPAKGEKNEKKTAEAASNESTDTASIGSADTASIGSADTASAGSADTASAGSADTASAGSADTASTPEQD